MARVLCPVTRVPMVTVVRDITTRWMMRMHDVLGYCTFPVPLQSEKDLIRSLIVN